jgi:hypothetical protein
VNGNKNYSAPFDSVDNDQNMLSLTDKYEDASEEHRKLCDELAHADADYHYAYYTAVMNLPKGLAPAEKRKAWASLKAHSEYEAYRLLQERQRASQQFLRSLEKKIDVRRSIGANMRNVM